MSFNIDADVNFDEYEFQLGVGEPATSAFTITHAGIDIGMDDTIYYIVIVHNVSGVISSPQGNTVSDLAKSAVFAANSMDSLAFEEGYVDESSEISEIRDAIHEALDKIFRPSF